MGPDVEGLVAETQAITLAPVTADELLGGVQPVLGQRSGPVSRRGDRLNLDGGMQPPQLASSIRRDLSALWRYVPQADRAASPGLPQVRVEVRAPNGQAGRLALRDRPEVTVPVTLSTTQQSRHGPRGEHWYEGGVVLEIPLSSISAAGTYSGRIEINLETL